MNHQWEVIYLHFQKGVQFKGRLYPNKWAQKTDLSRRTDKNFCVWGKAVFTTGHTGYQESITDSSFLGQHLIFTVAHIGNYQSPAEVLQNQKPVIESVIAKNITPNKYLDELDVPVVELDETRKLVQYIRDNSQFVSALSFSKEGPELSEFRESRLRTNELSHVSVSSPLWHREGERPIVLMDYGCKAGIVRDLKKLNLPLVQMPFDTSFENIMELKPRLVFLSNGPGNPQAYGEQIEVVKKLMEAKVPLWGICLGHQLTSLALGAETYELPFGHRGANHPVKDLLSGEVLITSQNHGYALKEEDAKELPSFLKNNWTRKEFVVHYRSLFDQTIEGISAKDFSIRTVQFHPEASPGPHEGAVFFDQLKKYLETNTIPHVEEPKIEVTPQNPSGLKKILIIGSGPIKIGQAQEFDYSGTQALRTLKEEGIDVVLVNSNPATIMTDPELSFRTYIEPITLDVVKKIIIKEKVEGIISTMGGQTALNICCDLAESGFLEENQVKLLGSGPQTIKMTEDRDLFASELDGLGFNTPRRYRVYNRDEALDVMRNKISFPFITRRDFALGGEGAKTIHSEEDFFNLMNEDLSFPITIEQNLHGYKEVELEVMVDCEKNGVIICSIENVDPCGVHTGDSITVAPAQTLSDSLYQNLRTIALKVAKHMGVVAGGANVQFAINPQDEKDIVVIEMNPRVSRSSALASKATGYPIAKISTKLALGYTLKDIENEITNKASVAFEPSLDYVAVKIPVFPFDKFPKSYQKLGPQMRSVGEVLGLAGNFSEAFMKALRGLELGLEVPKLDRLKTQHQELTQDYLKERLKRGEQLCLLSCLEALRQGISSEEIATLSKITPWFVNQMDRYYKLEKSLRKFGLEGLKNDRNLFKTLKQQGFSDKHIANLIKESEQKVFELRKKLKLSPSFKAVDTCSGEFRAYTPYFYSTYTGQVSHDSQPLREKLPANTHEVLAITGSGPNRIGQGIEFDYSGVTCSLEAQKQNFATIFINSNPGTVSTDFNSSHRLYFTPLYEEDVFDVLLFEHPQNVISCFSGQTGINLRNQIENSFRQNHMKLKNLFLGVPFRTIELTEDRKLFDSILSDVGANKLESYEVKNMMDLEKTYQLMGPPLMVRPSFVIGGESMYILYNDEDFNQFKEKFVQYAKKGHVNFLVERYLSEAVEFDVDLIRDNSGNTIFTLCEHIEYAGVHSGDSGMICPPISQNMNVIEAMKQVSTKMAELLQMVGPMNIQFAVKNEEVYCIEANPRGSRTIPFLSKASNISLIKHAVSALLQKEIPTMEYITNGHYFVKQSTFPFDRFSKDNIILGPKMRSTGETMGVGLDKEEAILKSYLGNFPKLNQPGKIIISMASEHKPMIKPFILSLYDLGYEFYATEGTHRLIKELGVPAVELKKISGPRDLKEKTIPDIIKEEDIKFVLNTPSYPIQSFSDGEQIRAQATLQGIPCFTRPENIKALIESLIGHEKRELGPISLQEIFNY